MRDVSLGQSLSSCVPPLLAKQKPVLQILIKMSAYMRYTPVQDEVRGVKRSASLLHRRFIYLVGMHLSELRW